MKDLYLYSCMYGLIIVNLFAMLGKLKFDFGIALMYTFIPFFAPLATIIFVIDYFLELI